MVILTTLILPSKNMKFFSIGLCHHCFVSSVAYSFLHMGFFSPSCSSSIAQSYLTLCDPTDCSTPGFSVPHHLLKFAQGHVHCIGGAIQLSHPLTPSSARNFFQHQGLFQSVRCSHQMTKILEFQLQLQFFQQVFRIDFP